jgi:hypothetical protein
VFLYIPCGERMFAGFWVMVFNRYLNFWYRLFQEPVCPMTKLDSWSLGLGRKKLWGFVSGSQINQKWSKHHGIVMNSMTQRCNFITLICFSHIFTYTCPVLRGRIFNSWEYSCFIFGLEMLFCYQGLSNFCTSHALLCSLGLGIAWTNIFLVTQHVQNYPFRWERRKVCLRSVPAFTYFHHVLRLSA